MGNRERKIAVGRKEFKNPSGFFPTPERTIYSVADQLAQYVDKRLCQDPLMREKLPRLNELCLQLAKQHVRHKIHKTTYTAIALNPDLQKVGQDIVATIVREIPWANSIEINGNPLYLVYTRTLYDQVPVVDEPPVQTTATVREVQRGQGFRRKTRL